MSESAPQLPGWQSVQDGLWADGRRVVSYRTAPNMPAPPPFVAPDGWQVLAVPALSPASARWVGQMRQLVAPPVTPAPPPQKPAVVPPAPVPTPVLPPVVVPVTPVPPPAVVPVPTPPVALPPVTRIVIPPDKRAFGLNSYNHVADQLIESVQYEGAEQNSAQNAQGGYTFRNYRAIGSYSAAWNLGQGLYLSGIKGRVTIDGAVLAFNGRPEDQPQYTPTGKRHNLYINGDVGGVTINHLLSVNGACAGVQNRCPDAEIYDLFSFGNSLPLFNVMGTMKVRRATIVAPALHFDGTNWAGGAPLYLLWPLVCDDLWIIGMDGMQRPVTNKPGRVFPNAAINSGGTWSNADHPAWSAPPAGPLVTASNCVLSGQWAGGAFGGASPHDGSGFTLAPNNVPDLTAQVLAVYRQVVGTAPSLSIGDGINQLHSLTRAAAVSANPSLASLPAAPNN